MLLIYVCVQLGHAGQLVTTTALQFCTMKAILILLFVQYCIVNDVTSWPVQPSCTKHSKYVLIFFLWFYFDVKESNMQGLASKI